MRTQKVRPGKSPLTPRATVATSSSSLVAPATLRPISSSCVSTRACSTSARPAAASESSMGESRRATTATGCRAGPG